MPRVTRQELFALHREVTTKAYDLMQRKNADYGGDRDALANFRADGARGIVVRLHDKLARLRTASKRDLQVKDESVEDCCIDVANYAVLYLAYHRSRRKPKSTKTTKRSGR